MTLDSQGYAECPRCTRKELPEELKPPAGIEYVRPVCRICREELTSSPQAIASFVEDADRDRAPLLAVWDGITYAHTRDAVYALKHAETFARRGDRSDMANALRAALVIAEDVMLTAGVYSGELASSADPAAHHS